MKFPKHELAILTILCLIVLATFYAAGTKAASTLSFPGRLAIFGPLAFSSSSYTLADATYSYSINLSNPSSERAGTYTLGCSGAFCSDFAYTDNAGGAIAASGSNVIWLKFNGATTETATLVATPQSLTGSSTSTVSVALTGSGGDTTPPSINSATIASNGTTVTIVFSENVSAGAGGSGGFALATPTSVLTYVSGTGTATIVFTSATTILSTDTPTLNYTQPGNGWEDGAGNDKTTCTGCVSVTNNSTQTGAPSYLLTETFDGSSACYAGDVTYHNCQKTWYNVLDGSANWKSTGLVGTYAYSVAASDLWYVALPTAYDELWYTLVQKFSTAYAGQTSHMRFLDASDNCLCAAQIYFDTGTMFLALPKGSGCTDASGPVDFTWNGTDPKYFKLHYKKGSGANSVCELWGSSTGAPGSWSSIASATTNTDVAQTAHIGMGSYPNGTTNIVTVDQIKVNNADITDAR